MVVRTWRNSQHKRSEVNRPSIIQQKAVQFNNSWISCFELNINRKSPNDFVEISIKPVLKCGIF